MTETADLQMIYQEVKFIKEHMVSREELNSALETVEILQNNDAVRQLLDSAKDIREGRTKQVRSVKDILG